MNKSLDFYNEFDKKLVRDYCNGNKRIENAMSKLFQYINPKANTILDIGCGIGWTSHELSKNFGQSEVHGIDLSPRLIECAKLLFQRNNLQFSNADINEFDSQSKYDIITMFDVYEHISIDERDIFHGKLNSILSQNARLILAMPSKFHQSYLKNHHPEGLQPIDETIDMTDIIKLANDLKGEIIFFEYQSIWNDFDYQYLVIQKNPRYDQINNIHFNHELNFDNVPSRLNRVNRITELADLQPSKYASKSILGQFFQRIIKLIVG